MSLITTTRTIQLHKSRRRGYAAAMICLFGLLGWGSSSANDANTDCVTSNANEADFPNSLVVNLNRDSAGLLAAWYDGATTRYRHGVLGDDVEASELHVIANHDGEQCAQVLVLDENEVFEDLAPRLVDMDGDGEMDVITVVSHAQLGARLAVFGHQDDSDSLVLKAATDNIGTAYRWLAPIGAGDFNGDGVMDVAYIDRPHLAKVLRVFSYTSDKGLVQIAQTSGLTNHRIGEDYISSGVRSCGGQLQLVTADARWKNVVATTLKDNELISETVGPFESVASIEAALKCEE